MESPLRVSRLHPKALNLLAEAGWRQDCRSDDLSHAAQLRAVGYPVGPRAAAILESLGGIQLEINTTSPGRPVGRDADYQGWGWLFRRLLGEARGYIPERTHTSRLSFGASDIISDCGQSPDVLLGCVCYSIGHVVSIVASTSQDQVILVDEDSELAYVWEMLGDLVVAYGSLEAILNGLAGAGYHTKILIDCADDDFDWSDAQLTRFGIRS